ncbi:vanadium-dependent haloperoxidase [Bacteroidales bacterium AH-315-I05]|nr:vanadium-dependent haloperoxidase [Bacteroidales bacterium AH-315-I05]
MFIGFWTFFSCASSEKGKQKNAVNQSHLIHELNDFLTEAIIQDGFTPPVASRIYAYSNIAAYECIILDSDEKKPLAGQLNALKNLPKPEQELGYDFRISMVEAFTKVAKQLVYRDHIIDSCRQKLLGELKNEINDDLKIENSITLGQKMAQSIIAWAKTDLYNETRNYPLFNPASNPGSWQPTPPTYKESIEPHWFKLRTFVLDSAGQFFPGNPEAFSTDTASLFYKLAYEVYDAVNGLDSGKYEIARFWDCNPQITIYAGHLMQRIRQLTPGGHWMGITKIAAKKSKLSLVESSEIYTKVAIGLADGFKSAWDVKYKTDLIRPETYINEYIDANWRPILETPLFPEHTSAHSVISAVSAIILTDYFGESFAFVDSTEMPFGLSPRSFDSFIQAADEAAISRLYGGIHYMPAIELGKTQGKKIGRYVVEKLATSSNPL